MRFVRYQSSTPTERGSFTGVFGLINGLAHHGRLSPEDRRWWRTNNDWYDAAYPDPAQVDPSLFDKTLHPLLSCWFKADAAHLVNRVDGYLELLDRYGIGWQRCKSDDPGRVLYEDEYQVVVEPY